MSKKTEDFATLDAFGGWDNNSVDFDFFSNPEEEQPTKIDEGEKQDKTETENLIQDEDSQTRSKEGKKDNEESESEEVELFSEPVADSEEAEPEQGGQVEDLGVNNSALATLTYLKEKGWADVDVENLEEEEDINLLVEKGLESGLEDRVEELFQDMPPVIKQMIQYHTNGGDISEILSSLKSESPLNDVSKMDMDDPEHQKAVVVHALKEMGYDDEELIKVQIDGLEESGKLKSFASKKYNTLKEAREKALEQKVEAQKKQREEQKQREREYKQSISKLVKETEEISGLTLSPKEKKALPSYMTDRSFKLSNGQKITNMQKDLYSALQDPEKALLLGKLLKSDFDFSEFKRNAKTTVAKEERQSIRRTGKSNKNTAIKKRSLADYF